MMATIEYGGILQCVLFFPPLLDFPHTFLLYNDLKKDFLQSSRCRLTQVHVSGRRFTLQQKALKMSGVFAVHVLPRPFQLRYWRRSEKEDTASVQRTVGNQTSTVIRGVKGSTAYYISVRAYNTAGTGPPSPAVNVTTKKPREYQIAL